MRVDVEAYSGYRYGQYPKVIIIDEKRCDVEVIESYRTPEGVCFIVLVDDKKMKLFYDELKDEWHLKGF